MGDQAQLREMASWSGTSEESVAAFEQAFDAAFPLKAPQDAHFVLSEDGLMLNTGFMFARASPFAYRELLRTRGLSMSGSPLTFHPWWEQAALVWQLMREQTLAPFDGLESQSG